jgi:flagellar biosynthetic protein FlhB
MAEDDGEDKQFDATEQRRRRAREEGQVARSQDLGSSLSLFGALAAFYFFSGGMFAFLSEYGREQWGGHAWLSIDPETFSEAVLSLGARAAWAVLPLLLVLAAVGIAVNVSQTGLLFLPSQVRFDLGRLDPLKRLRELFSVRNVMRIVFGLLKFGIVGAVGAASLWSSRGALVTLSHLALPQAVLFIAETALWTCLPIAGALLVLGLFDYGFQWWNLEQKLKMSFQEMKDEMKEQEGDPHVKASRRSMQRQMSAGKIREAVPRADFVVTNPTELAVALRYDRETMPAPVVVAKGKGFMAAKIRKLAMEHGVPIVENKPLAQALFKDVAIDGPIPEDRYAAVAEILRYVYQLKGKKVA